MVLKSVSPTCPWYFPGTVPQCEWMRGSRINLMRLATEEDVGESISGRKKVYVSKVRKDRNGHIQDVFKEQKMDTHN